MTTTEANHTTEAEAYVNSPLVQEALDDLQMLMEAMTPARTIEHVRGFLKMAYERGRLDQAIAHRGN